MEPGQSVFFRTSLRKADFFALILERTCAWAYLDAIALCKLAENSLRKPSRKFDSKAV
jgi:hypothetical protein